MPKTSNKTYPLTVGVAIVLVYNWLGMLALGNFNQDVGFLQLLPAAILVPSFVSKCLHRG